VAGGEFAGEFFDGFGIAGEEPAAEGFGEVVEGGGCSGDRVDGGGDLGARIKHGVELGDSVVWFVVWFEEVGRDGVQDEFASTAGDEPVVGEGDGDFCVWGGHVYDGGWNN